MKKAEKYATENANNGEEVFKIYNAYKKGYRDSSNSIDSIINGIVLLVFGLLVGFIIALELIRNGMI